MLPSKRRFSNLQVSAVLGIAIALVLVAVRPFLIRLWDVSQLKKMGAVVEYDDYSHIKSLRIPPGCSLKALTYLGSLPSLKMLILPVTDAKDADLEPLLRATSLEELILSGNRDLTDASLQFLVNLVNLKGLYLTDVPIEGPGLKALSTLPKLELLDVQYTKLNDETLANLSGLTSLKILNISYTACSDEGLHHLETLKNLQTLWVLGAKVTPEGAKSLNKAMPTVSARFGL